MRWFEREYLFAACYLSIALPAYNHRRAEAYGRYHSDGRTDKRHLVFFGSIFFGF
jgi:hypothetical protein